MIKIETKIFNEEKYEVGFKLTKDKAVIMIELENYQDPYDEAFDKDIWFEDGWYIVEVPKQYFDDDTTTTEKDGIISDYADALIAAYKLSTGVES